MKNAEGTMAEADITINGVALNFAQSMTLRVAISTFLMTCKAVELGEIGPLYEVRCIEIMKIIHGAMKKEMSNG